MNNIFDHNLSSESIRLCLNAAKHLKDYTDKWWHHMPPVGICQAIRNYLSRSNNCDDITYVDVGEFVYIAARHWEKYQGVIYPVPHPIFSPNYGYGIDPFKWRGKYGASRRELLAFIIDFWENQ